jgi:stage V sporulation protein R
MEYDQLSKGNRYGFQKIYELVINTDPVYAYLLSSNRIVDQKLVMAHVYGHADFFKHNAWFSGTDRKMMDVMANHGTKIRRYMEKYGQNEVEDFIDKVLSLENLLDVRTMFENQEINYKREEGTPDLGTEDQGNESSAALKTFMRAKKRNEVVEGPEQAKDSKVSHLMDLAEKEYKHSRDIMRFLSECAPLEEWQADIIALLREEAYYFLPQRMTKIMNEGWASYWHSTIMTRDAARASEIIDFADVHSGVMAMSKQNINPYKIGIELMRDIEYRWDTGRFGKDYLECDDMVAKQNWDMKTMAGKEKIFQVRKSHNDITFIDEFFTQEFCQRQKLFTYKFNARTSRFEIDTRDFLAIKQKLLSSLTNFGQPVIEIESSNFQNRGELLLRHVHQGVDLDMSYAADTCRNIHALWKRPVNIATIQDGKEIVFVHNGKEFAPVKK